MMIEFSLIHIVLYVHMFRGLDSAVIDRQRCCVLDNM